MEYAHLGEAGPFTALCREAVLAPTFTSGATQQTTIGHPGPFTGLLAVMA